MRAKGILQMSLVERVSHIQLEKCKLQSAIETAVLLNKALAARDYLCPGWANFHPLAPGMAVQGPVANTAYEAFMAHERARHVAGLTDEQAIAEAVAKLAASGLGEGALLDHARLLALPKIERLEKCLASKAAEQEGLIGQIFAMTDRHDRRAAITGSKAG